jgi:hypothetical protein
MIDDGNFEQVQPLENINCSGMTTIARLKKNNDLVKWSTYASFDVYT